MTSYSQENPKFAVEVEHTGNDIVGGRLAFAVKEGIRKSESFRISYKDELRVKIILLTIDNDSYSPGNSSIYSFVLCWVNPTYYFSFFITSYVGQCGSSRVDEVAERIISLTDKRIEGILKFLSDDSTN